MRTKILTAFAAAALTFTLAGCDGNGGGNDTNDPDSNAPGTYTGEVTGAVSQTLTGTAASAGGTVSGGWGIGLGSVSSGIAIASNVDRPGKGTYSFVDISQASSATSGQYVATISLAGGASFGSTSGSLEITSSSATEVKGTFTFNAKGVLDPSSTVTVTGSFNAVNVDAGGSAAQ
ncbi:MAG: hypothetical protein KDD65_17950 [Bacteroidetes bacterium]|nr:hypothetical protein [Bacteroidota bacterium]